MPSRRPFLLPIVAAVYMSCVVPATGAPDNFKGDLVFNRILTEANKNKWRTLPIGDLMGNIARQFEGTPYKEGTLELTPDREICSVNLNGLDCVTFFESTLDLARIKGGHTPKDLLAEISLTRYRGGVPGDYSTRLHYFSDWLVDNDKKHVVKILDLPGAETFSEKVGFMSTHPRSYKALVAHPELIPVIKNQEATINNRALKYIPIDKMAAIESQLKTGDIVGVTTDIKGLDIAHTGLVIRDKKGIAHFMDASSLKRKMKVTLEPLSISQSLKQSKNFTGAMFARPLKPLSQK